MADLSETDFTVRLNLITCWMADKADEIATDLQLGKSCIENERLLQVITTMFSLIKRYQTLDTGIAEEDNCLTEEDLQTVFDYISDKTEICFAPIGTQYT